jgi:hypothetical protein
VNQRGAVLVTLAYALPLAGVVLFVLLSIAYFVNARTTLEEAVEMGVRAASTRAKVGALWRNVTPGDLVSRIDDPENFEEFFVYRSPSTNHSETYTLLTEVLGRIDLPNGSGIEALPRQYRLALAFTLRSVRDSLGLEMVRYPCGINSDGSLLNSEFSRTPGCLICYPVRHAFEGDFCDPNQNDPCTPQTMPSGRLSPSFVSIACWHNPNDLFLRPLFGLFSVLGTDFNQELFLFAISSQDKSTGLLMDQ